MLSRAMFRWRPALTGLLVAVPLALTGRSALALMQGYGSLPPSVSATSATPSGATPVMVTPGRGRPGGPGGPPGRPGGPPGEKKPEKGEDGKKPDDGKGKDKGKEGDKKEESGPKPITRPESPDASPRPEELRVKPDKDGKIRFQFHGQKWPAVLTWLADWSGMSLDWQQLPGDFVNLTTARKYTVREARDLINQHLLARGYTMLIQDGVLWVNQISKLDSGLVPRVTPAELAERDPHEFVKVSFQLDWLLAETAAKEFEPMKSPNGKLSPLTATNRLEAMDSVTNLRQMYELLREEQSGDGQQHLVRKFVLQHTRAEDVVAQVSKLLGIDAQRSPQPKSRQEVEQRMKMAQMRMQQAAQQAKKGGAPPKQKPEVHLVAIPRENSILANAPPDKMALVEQAILAIDVAMDRGNTYRKSIERMYIYRLTAIDPEPLVKTLQEIGNLDFNTRLEVDEQNNAIIAYASLSDHVTIRTLIDKLDGSMRQFAVIQLRRLEADYVAGTIQFMMGAKEDKQQERRRPWWDDYGRRNEKKNDEFTVEADIESNRLLLRANEDELEQVQDLLMKLGEIPPEEGNPATVRVIDAPDDAGLNNWLDKIRRTWNGPNQLKIELPPQPRGDRQGPAAQDRAPKEPASGDVTTSLAPDGRTPLSMLTLDGRQLRGFSLRENAHVRGANGHVQRKPGPRMLAGVTDGRTAGPIYRLLARSRPVPLHSVSEERRPTTSPGPADAAAQVEPQSTPAASPAQVVPTRPPTADQKPPAASPGQVVPTRPPTTDQKPPAAPPIKISRAPDGRLIITCQDPAALDQLENLMLEFPPPRKEYEIFRLKYADATYTAMDLEDFFKDEKDSGRRGGFFWNPWDYGGSDSSSKTSRLSKRKPLKFLAQIETNSILVQGASPTQLATISELITNVFDRRDPIDTKLIRSSRTFTIRYSKARTVAETIKEVYRDLLSANDKSLQNGERRRTERVFFDFGDNGPKKIKFKGALSIGVDELSNTLLVSTSPRMMEEIGQLIEDLDEAARPTTTVGVVNTGLGVNGEELQRTLSRMLNGSSGGSDRSRRSSDRRSGDRGDRGDRYRGRGR
jgi:type II secretory pathway component GspD/PulD (secretin)